MKNRGQGLPMNVVVLFIIILVVMIVVLAIFTREFGKSTAQLDVVQAKNEARTACISSDDFNSCVKECDEAISQGKIPAKCKIKKVT